MRKITAKPERRNTEKINFGVRNYYRNWYYEKNRFNSQLVIKYMMIYLIIMVLLISR